MVIAWRLLSSSPESGSDHSTNARSDAILASTAQPVIVCLLSTIARSVPGTGDQ